ncbi:hypothetical protein MUK42_19841 [Musa troglodytarum]|uniref:Uncharacterized protein n=1 Tax=Musa troglodytarum TaxID=320322 RepID=A0A9E7FUH8_9LILI|nr:hypothetical protein MUK42_19841 [Musa troglodytarum]
MSNTASKEKVITNRKKAVVAAQASDLGIMVTNTIPDDGASWSPEELLDHPFNMYSRCTSAPASSASAGSTYAHLSHLICPPSESPATFGVPFNWEEKPGTPKCEFNFRNDNRCSEFDFDFGFRGNQYEPPAVAATDEVFEKKRILPLKPPPRLYFQSVDNGGGATSSQRPPRPPRTRRLWSFRHQSKLSEEEEEDPFTVAMVEATRESSGKDKDPVSFLAKGVVCRKWRFRGLLPRRCPSNKHPGKYALLSSSSASSNQKIGAMEMRNEGVGSTQSHDSVHKTHCTAEGEASKELKKKSRKDLLNFIGFHAGGRKYCLGCDR